MTDTTLTETIDQLSEVYTEEQLVRAFALQQAADIARLACMEDIMPSDLTELADYIVDGFDVDTDAPDFSPIPDYLWKSALDDEAEVGAITVSDLAGFLTLPTSAILEDSDGDQWRHYAGDRDNFSAGWAYNGGYSRFTPGGVFEDYDLDFIVTNPKVLAAPATVTAPRQVESIFVHDVAGLDALPVDSVVIGESYAWQREAGDWTSPYATHTSTDLLVEYGGTLLVAHIPGDASFPQLAVCK